MTTDSLTQLAEARDGVYSDWHPPIMSWLWRQILLTGLPEKPGMLSLQLIILWTGIFLCAQSLAHRVWIRLAIALTFFLIPPTLGWAGAVTKDMLMLGSAMIAAGLLMQLRRSNSPWLVCCGMGLALWFACAQRHNGMFLSVGLAVGAGSLLYEGQGMRKALLGGLLLAVLPIAAAHITNKALTTSQTFPLASLLSFDISGIAVLNKENPIFSDAFQAQASRSLLHEDRSLQELAQWYKPQDWMYLSTNLDGHNSPPPVIRTWDSARFAELQSLWKEVLRTYPTDYLRHRSEVFLALLAWGERPVTDPACFSDRGAVDGVLQHKPTAAQAFLSWRLNWIAARSYLFRPWPYYFVGWVLLGYLLVTRPYYWREAGSLVTSGLLHESAFFFITPAAEYRYSAWLILSVILTIGLIAFRQPDLQSKTTTQSS